MFRMFRWVLTTQEDIDFLSWEKAAVIGAKTRLRESKAKALKDVLTGDVAGKGKRQAICDEVLAPPLRKKEKKTSPPCQKVEPPLEDMSVG